MMDLKTFIRVARAKKGMSQKQLAEASGVSECSIHTYIYDFFVSFI